jgi:hypothetical protein
MVEILPGQFYGENKCLTAEVKEQGRQNSVVQNAVAERGVNPEDATQRALPCLKVSPRQVLKQMISRESAAHR